MRLAAALWFVLALGVICRPLQAQDAAAAAATAQEQEERYQKLRANIEDLLNTQATLEKRLSALNDELQTLRQNTDRASGNYATRDDLRKLADDVREIDRKREEDKKLILEELRKLAATPVPVVAPEPPKRAAKPELAPDPNAGAPAVPKNGYTYTVKDGDTLAAIVNAYRQNGVKVTVDQVLKANPNLKPRSMRVNQKIFIPDPNAAP
jgi:LysM repeat protein